jgi:uroporphyrinogen decarboxylase
MISPAMFKQFMTPYYQRIRAVMERHYTPVTLMDSDGDIRALIPLWIECGITGFLPMEVAAGMDVVELRREYGQTICMKGGFDKRILASNRAAIRTEIERLRPVIEGGGYICSCDHGVPSDVPWENYRYFVECLKVVHGLA